MSVKKEILNYLKSKDYELYDYFSESTLKKILNKGNYINNDDKTKPKIECYSDGDTGIIFNLDDSKILIVYNYDLCTIGCCINEMKEIELKDLTLNKFKNNL